MKYKYKVTITFNFYGKDESLNCGDEHEILEYIKSLPLDTVTNISITHL